MSLQGVFSHESVRILQLRALCLRWPARAICRKERHGRAEPNVVYPGRRDHRRTPGRKCRRIRSAATAPHGRGGPRLDATRSASRPIFPIVTGPDMQMFGLQDSGSDQVGALPDVDSTSFVCTSAAETDRLIKQLKADDTVMPVDPFSSSSPPGWACTST